MLFNVIVHKKKNKTTKYRIVNIYFVQNTVNNVTGCSTV